MTNKGYMAFMPDWRETKRDLSPEQWYELEDYMFQLRFDGIDTDPSTIQDKEIKLAWRLIRPALKKIIRNYNYKQKQLSNNTQTENRIEANTEFDNENDTIPQTTTESPSEGQETPKNEVINEVKNEVKNEAPNEVITTSPEIYNNDDDDKDFRYGEIDTTNPMMSFLRDDEPEKDNKINKKIDNKKDKKDMDYTEVAKGYIEQMDGITFNSPEWHQKLISIIKENEPHLRWGAIYETANRIMQNAA